MSKTFRKEPIRRNHAWDAELLRKCSVHGKTRKQARRGDRQSLRQEVVNGY